MRPCWAEFWPDIRPKEAESAWLSSNGPDAWIGLLLGQGYDAGEDHAGDAGQQQRGLAWPTKEAAAASVIKPNERVAGVRWQRGRDHRMASVSAGETPQREWQLGLTDEGGKQQTSLLGGALQWTEEAEQMGFG